MSLAPYAKAVAAFVSTAAAGLLAALLLGSPGDAAITTAEWIGIAATTLKEWADGARRPVFFAWNGTPFDAYPGDTADEILRRYFETRNLWQAAQDNGHKLPEFKRAT